MLEAESIAKLAIDASQYAAIAVNAAANFFKRYEDNDDDFWVFVVFILYVTMQDYNAVTKQEL
jgi:hypothetical protein